jgi:hypothetical protein
MTDLSPITQDVINAAVEAGGGYGRATPLLHARIAAALRAAAEQGRLGPDHWEGSQSDERELGWNAAMEWVEKIAAELETSTTENR